MVFFMGVKSDENLLMNLSLKTLRLPLIVTRTRPRWKKKKVITWKKAKETEISLKGREREIV